MTLEDTPHSLVEALGTSEAFLSFQEALSRVATVDRPVLIVGERGTGKELAAARLHYLSHRWQKPLVTVNCAALSESLLESELFGHEAGSFTGATAKRIGRFEQADGGTLFLDEIGAMPLRMQESILRVVEYGTLQRVGSSRAIQVDVRLIAATNANLPDMAARNTFKRDLLDRLSFEVLTLPPLRERGEDILTLAKRFAASMAIELGLAGYPEFSAQAVATLHAYAWPGNIRELKNTVERAVFRNGLSITQIQLDPFETPWKAFAEPSSFPATTQLTTPPTTQRPAQPATESKISTETARLPDAASAPAHEPLSQAICESFNLAVPLLDAQGQIEQGYLKIALQRTRHNQRHAAEMLGLTYHQFRGLYRKHKQAIEDT